MKKLYSFTHYEVAYGEYGIIFDIDYILNSEFNTT
jgi:hypothetical protein